MKEPGTMSQVREQQIWLLNVLESLAAVLVVVGAIAWGWYRTLLVAFILTVLPYAGWRTIRNLEQEPDPSRHPEELLAKEGSIAPGLISCWPVDPETKHGRTNRVDQPVIQTTTAMEQKGTLHESIACRHA
jgi:hypothetical protein